MGTSGAMLGIKLYILGVMGYDKPIWDVLALQGEQEEAGEHLHGAKFENYVPIRQLTCICPLDISIPRTCLNHMINPHRVFPTTQKKGLLPCCRVG